MAATFDRLLEAFADAQQRYLEGDPAEMLALFSVRGDVTLCNPVGPPQRGRDLVHRAAAAPSERFSAGHVIGFDEISRIQTDDLGYVVWIEHGTTHIDGGQDAVGYALRVTMVGRREDGEWRIVHRHADPIIGARPLGSIVSG